MSYDLMFQKAIELQNNGALNEAEDIYLKLLEAMPENSDVWNLLGLAAQSKGNAGRAADCFLAAIRYAPAPFAPHFFNLGLAYRMLGKKREALEALQRAADLQPDLKEAWNYLGLTQEETGDHQEAVKSFCRALDIDGAYNEARANLCFYTKDKETLLQLADEQESDFQANLLAAESCEEPAEREHYLRRATAANPYHTGGLLALFVLFVILYMAGVGQWICIAFGVTSASALVWLTFYLNGRFGEHGLMKLLARKQHPRYLINRISPRKLFTVKKKNVCGTH